MFRSAIARTSVAHARTFHSTISARKTVTETVKETADEVNKRLGKGLANAIETGENVAGSAKSTICMFPVVWCARPYLIFHCSVHNRAGEEEGRRGGHSNGPEEERGWSATPSGDTSILREATRQPQAHAKRKRKSRRPPSNRKELYCVRQL